MSTFYIETGSTWKIGYVEPFIGKQRNMNSSILRVQAKGHQSRQAMQLIGRQTASDGGQDPLIARFITEGPRREYGFYPGDISPPSAFPGFPAGR
jgi:hypothetical protein